uniref:Uncharacterized protein n=1 Tax=Oreochromis aureus TaxID=47969 RepID=A0AAZ1Y1J1_OREAU
WSAPVLSQLLGASRGDPPGRPRDPREGPGGAQSRRQPPPTTSPAARRRSDCSPSRGASPAPLRTPLPCSNMPEAVHLGDLLRIWVRSGVRLTPSPGFSRASGAHQTPPEPRRFPGHGPLSRGEPIPGRPALHKEKRTLPGAPASFSGFVCVTALAPRAPISTPPGSGFEPDSLSIGRASFLWLRPAQA